MTHSRELRKMPVTRCRDDGLQVHGPRHAQRGETAMPQTFSVGSRSIFVTVTAWVFILLGAGAALSALARGLAFASLVPGERLMGDAPVPVLFGGLSGVVLAYLPWVLAAAALLSTATVVCAVGLLLRRDWARRLFIAQMGLAIVVNLLGLWMQYEVVQAVVDATLAASRLPAPFMDVLGGFVTAARVMAGLVTLGISLLLVWIIRRLMSSGVRQEFA
jgi:hypothetical protein